MDTGRPQRSCKKTTFYREDFWVTETRTKKTGENGSKYIGW